MIVSRIRSGAPTGEYDDQGNPVVGAAVTEPVEIVAFAPQVSEETAEAFGTQVLDAGTVYADRDTDIRPSDLLVVRGNTWQVEGNPRDWLSPYPLARDGLEILVRRVS